jgi:hypothetical protein
MKPLWKFRRLYSGRILFIKLSRTLPPEEQSELIKEIGAMKLDPKQMSILVDHRVENINLSTMQIFSLTEPYRSVEKSYSFRVALLFKQIGPNEQFYETVCFNRGYTGIRVFDDCRKAANWLVPDTKRACFES